jgi:hypothetical protein
MPMKLKLVVVDLEISPRAKRIALRIGLPLLVLGVASAAFASVPVTFTAGSTLHAADLNSNFSALDARITALENAPKIPHYAQATVQANGTILEQNNNVSGNLSVTKTGTGSYQVTWNPADFPNGAAPLITPYLNNPEVISISKLVQFASADTITVSTTTSGASADGAFTVLVVGQ